VKEVREELYDHPAVGAILSSKEVT